MHSRGRGGFSCRLDLRLHLVFALSISACGDDTTVFGGPTADAQEEGNDRGEVIADQIDIEFPSDDPMLLIAQTGWILRALNDGEINQASFALDVLSTAVVEDYASQLIAQHMLANADLDSVMRTYGVAFQPTQAEAMLAADANAGIAMLRTTPPDQIDLAFLDLRIQMHSAALVMLDELGAINDTQPMDDFIAQTHDMVDDHLDQAIDLFEDLD